MAEPTPAREPCGELLTPEDGAKAAGALLCPECYAPQAPRWQGFRLEAGEGEERRDG